MTALILLVFIGLLWAAVLAPSLWRHFQERPGVGSIDHFHHQLQLLEQAAPKTVAPAYRLHNARGGVVAQVDSSRPKLTLLRPTNDAWAADVAGNDGCHYERIGVLDRPEALCVPPASADLPAYRRELARRRCMVVLRCLCGVAISTGIIGIWPGLHLAWIFTALSGLAALGLVGLMAYAKELETQMRIRRALAASREVSEASLDGDGATSDWGETLPDVRAVAH
jgi:hypothetical protein